jgi:hypothetical protein
MALATRQTYQVYFITLHNKRQVINRYIKPSELPIYLVVAAVVTAYMQSFFDPADEEYIDLYNGEINPRRAECCWNSNNSISLLWNFAFTML